MSSRQAALFRDREDAGRQLAERLRSRAFRDPLVLAIPRGGVATGAVLARELGAELDVVLSRKLRSPFQPEYAIGAVSEDGRVTLSPDAWMVTGASDGYVEAEKRRQLGEIERRKKLIRVIRPAARVAGRSVIVTDDGIATGSTMVAALQTVRAQGPHVLLVAVPVAAPDRLAEVRRWCDEAVCLLAPEGFWSIGKYYENFDPVEDEEVIRLLREALPAGVPEDRRTIRHDPHTGGMSP